MSELSAGLSTSEFFAKAAELAMIPPADAASLAQEVAERKSSASAFALESGRLTHDQVDIIQTLLTPETAIPGYRIESLIGRGGMGVVYLAEQLNLGRRVAIKTVLLNRLQDVSAVSRFEREARTIGQLRHPNIVAAFDFGCHAGRCYLALEYVQGTDLDAHIRAAGPLEETTALHLLRQAAAGLSHAAQHDVVHRDIKPANLMLLTPPEGSALPDGVPMVKITDFGLVLREAADEDESTRLTNNLTLGTPYYMAPEQFESSQVDVRADIYSLGATLVHMVNGKAPFAGLKLSQLITAKFQGGMEAVGRLPVTLSPGTRTLIEQMLAREAADRPQTYPDLLAHIDRLLAEHERGLAETTTISPGHGQVIAVESTLEMPQAAQGNATIRPRESRSRRVWFGSLAGAFLLLMVFAVSRDFRAPPSIERPVRDDGVRPVGPTLQLFTGKGTSGWIVDHGSWLWSSTRTALEGTAGVIRRPIPASTRAAAAATSGLTLDHSPGDSEAASRQPSPSEGTAVADSRSPMSWYRLEIIFAELTGETANRQAVQELQFGLSRTADAMHVLRRTGSHVELIPQAASRSALGADSSQPAAEPHPSLTLPAEGLVAVTLERLPAGWFVEVNGQPFAAVPRRPDEELPEIRLRAGNAAVDFSDAVITELAVGNPTRAEPR